MVYQLAERRATPDRCHFGSIIPEDWKDPPHDGKPEETRTTPPVLILPALRGRTV